MVALHSGFMQGANEASLAAATARHGRKVERCVPIKHDEGAWAWRDAFWHGSGDVSDEAATFEAADAGLRGQKEHDREGSSQALPSARDGRPGDSSVGHSGGRNGRTGRATVACEDHRELIFQSSAHGGDGFDAEAIEQS